MRRIVISTLVLLPILAHAQARSATQTVQPATNLQASNAAPASPPARTAIARAPSFYDTIETHVDPSFSNDLAHNSGTLSYTIYGADTDAPVAPKLVHTVNRQLPLASLNGQSADVTVQFTVDLHGVPKNIEVIHSAGAEADAKTIEAVRQYRFEPAVVNHQPTFASVTVDLKLHER